MIELLRTNSLHPDFGLLVSKQDAELREHYPSLPATYIPYNAMENNDNIIVAYRNKHPVGCGYFKVMDEHTVEVKRLYVLPACRGHGMAAAILAELEDWAKELSYTHVVVETDTEHPDAIHLCRKSGYSVTTNYGPYAGMDSSVCMAKDL